MFTQTLKVAFLILAITLSLMAQNVMGRRDTAGTSVCGTNAKSPQRGVDLIQVSCLDYDGLRKVAPWVAWPAGKQTQVLVHGSKPGAVRINLNMGEQWAELVKDAYGRWAAMLVFEGTDYDALKVTVYEAVE